MDPVARDDTIHEMASSLARLGNNPVNLLTTTSSPSLAPSTGVVPFGSPSYRHQNNNHHCPNRHLPQDSSPRSNPIVDSFIPWSTIEGESTYIRPSNEFNAGRRLSAKSGSMQYQHHGRRSSISSSLHTSSSSTMSATSHVQSPRSTASPFPAPSKPLPAVPASPPTSIAASPHLSSQLSWSDKSSFVDMDRFSQSSSSAGAPTNSSEASRSSLNSMLARPSVPPRPPEHLRLDQVSDFINDAKLPPPRSAVDVLFSKQLAGAEKRKANSIYHIDMSLSSSTVATKHGNNIIKFWSVPTGSLFTSVKVQAYIEARSRSRDYIIRSHTILSESAQLAAIATHFGRTIEIWNFTKPKRLQTIEDADRWVASRFESYGSGWSALAAYRSRDSVIDLFAATTRDKKPFLKVRTIDLRKAGLPLLPQFPELAISSTSPLLIAASGPRTPRAGHPPPDRETLLVAWDISDYRDVSSKPYRVVRPWQHHELETAMPCELAIYGDIIISMWIPAGHCTVTKTKASGDFEYTLAPTPVPFRYVLVWDLSENSTRTYGIPNTTCCISPDCRFVAYCHIADKRSKLAILDAQSGDELWSVGGEGAQTSLQSMGDLAKVTEIGFSPDSLHIILGDSDGNASLFDVRETIK